MKNKFFLINNEIIYIFIMLVFAVASSWLLSAPGMEIRTFFGSMIMLAFGPMTEHFIEKTSITRWILDSASCLALLLMILLRYRWNSRYLIGISFLGVILWFSAAFI